MLTGANAFISGQHTCLLPFSSACSTFLLAKGNELLVGHNLDESFEVPGMIVINKRGVAKTNRTWYELSTSKKHASPTISWISKYGSLTFNPLGREFPDGGLNETGLSIQEMTLAETTYPEDDTRPTMFMMQWIQYQLDNFALVEQVLANLFKIVLDGWGWHFLISDREGNCAAIEFIDGEPTIHSDESLPVPALCNTLYSQEMRELEAFEGFGGEKHVDLDDQSIPRFVHAAYMLKNFEGTASPPAVEYAFDILRKMERGDTKWSYVIDVKKLRVYFRTSIQQKTKYLDLEAFDLSCDTPVEILDIDSDLTGDVSEKLIPCTSEVNRQFIAKAFGSLDGSRDLSKFAESQGSTMEQLIDMMAEYPESTICN